MFGILKSNSSLKYEKKTDLFWPRYVCNYLVSFQYIWLLYENMFGCRNTIQTILKLFSQADSAECVTRLRRSAFLNAALWMCCRAKWCESAAYAEGAHALSTLVLNSFIAAHEVTENTAECMIFWQIMQQW